MRDAPTPCSAGTTHQRLRVHQGQIRLAGQVAGDIVIRVGLKAVVAIPTRAILGLRSG